jgi:hypothetical protein
VTGAAALYLSVHPDASPADVLDYLQDDGSRAQNTPEGLVTNDDPDGIPERVLYIPTTP